jgi:hypothetical protein
VQAARFSSTCTAEGSHRVVRGGEEAQAKKSVKEMFGLGRGRGQRRRKREDSHCSL